MLNCTDILNFNSTMVRLKVRQPEEEIPGSRFQFHYGTIKSKAVPPYACFLYNFNSTMVRLKVLLLISTLPPILHFNSTMVRLKEKEENLHLPYCLFQFHYGTIKRDGNSGRVFHPRISIPLWYD